MLTQRAVKRTLAILALGSAFAVGQETIARASCVEPVNGHQGWIISNPITSPMFWPTPRSDAVNYVLHWASLVSNSAFYGHVTEYGVHPGTVGQLLVLSNQYAVSGNVGLDESTIQWGLIIALTSANRIPQNGENFVVFLPPGVTSNYDTSSRFAGHHGWLNWTFSDHNQHAIIYSVVEYFSDFASTDYVMSHELFETYTDPITGTDSNGNFVGLGWYDDATDLWASGGEREIADMCVNLALETKQSVPPYWTMNGSTSPLAQVWSEQMCNCH
jgi:hypothetical protein